MFGEALAKAQPRCVKLYGAGTNVEAGYATGLLVSNDGLILTAQGIYLAGERMRAVLPDGGVYDVMVVRRSEPLQLALLKIDAKTPNYFELSKTADLAPTFSRVATELRSQYLIAFTPAALDGKVHKLEVRVNRPGMTVRARKSYLAASDRS